jgi:hypothetical protein
LVDLVARTENEPPRIIKEEEEEVEAREEGVPCAWSIQLRWARRKKRRAVVAWRAGERGGWWWWCGVVRREAGGSRYWGRRR